MKLIVKHLGLSEYNIVHDLQKQLFMKRQKGEISDVLILVEHRPVLTMGRNAKDANILTPEPVLKQHGIELVKIGRGGDVTFHGPGQLVGYPIINIGEKNLGVVDYVGKLEEMIIAVLADFDIKAGTDPKNRGVWIGSTKVAAIGVKVSRKVTMHGFALNVNTDLDYYRHIVPCGIADKGVTSLHLHRRDIKMADVEAKVIEKFCKVFDYDGFELSE